MAKSPHRGRIAASGGAAEQKGGTARALSLLEFVARAHEPVSMKAIIEALDLPNPTAHRLVSSLEDRGMLVRCFDRKGVTVGPALRALAVDVMQASLSGVSIHTVLVNLSGELGETCNIGVMAGNEVVYVDRVEGVNSPLRLQFHVGSRVPLHCTAMGKLLMSNLSDRMRTQLLAAPRMPPPTPRTIDDTAALEAELDRIRERGYAIDDEEYILGVFCVAAPIFDGDRIVAALAVQAPKVRLHHETVEECLPKLRRAADEIGRSFAADRAGLDSASLQAAPPLGKTARRLF